MQIIALIASVVTIIQVVSELFFGSAICPHEGCKVVEGLTAIPPLYFNLMGFIFFQSVFWTTRLQKRMAALPLDLLSLLLMSGLVFDSVLLAYQIFVARTFCGYCLLIFVLVLMLNILHGQRQILIGLAALGVTIFSFSALTFMPTGVFSQSEPLKSASYGMKSCSAPSKEIYLIFSADCPYCENVLQTLSNCNSCDLYLNPIDRIESFDNMVVDLNPDFAPDVNRLVLGVLGIDTVPVLVVKTQEGLRFIRGEKKIVNYVKHACFTEADVLYYEDQTKASDDGITLLTDQEGECAVEIDCEPE
jgi:hypothetical protein